MLLAVAAYLYCNLFLLPRTPILQSDDQVYFWMYAQRLLHGEHAYLDFFQFTPPGTDLFFLFLLKSFGEHIWVLNAAVILLGVALCWVCLVVARHIMEPHLALLCAFAYLVFIFAKPLNATHHWFSVLVAMCAVAILMPARTANRIAVAGALLGLATFCTQTHGIVTLLAIAIFLVWERFHERQSGGQLLMNPAILCVSFLASVLTLNSYFIATAGVRRLWDQQVAHVRKYRIEGWLTPNFGLPAPLDWHNIFTLSLPVFVYVLLPVIYLFSLVVARRNSPTSDDHRRIILVALVGASLFAEVALSPNWLRIYSVSMPGIVLAIWAIGRATRVRRYASPAIGAAMLLFASLQVWSRHHRPFVITELPAGVAAVPAPLFEQIDWIAKHTQPGDFVFQAGWPGLYLPLGLRNPVFIDTVGTNEQTRPEHVELTIRQLDQKQVRYVIWSPRLNAPSSDHPGEDQLGPLLGYLHGRYALIKTFVGADELWERRPSDSSPPM